MIKICGQWQSSSTLPRVSQMLVRKSPMRTSHARNWLTHYKTKGWKPYEIYSQTTIKKEWMLSSNINSFKHYGHFLKKNALMNIVLEELNRMKRSSQLISVLQLTSLRITTSKCYHGGRKCSLHFHLNIHDILPIYIKL